MYRIIFIALFSLLLSACSAKDKYLFPQKKKLGVTDQQFFLDKRIPEYNPGGDRFTENKELFKQYVKDKKDSYDQEMAESYIYDENINHNNLLDLYIKNNKNGKAEFTRNLQDEYKKGLLKKNQHKKSIVANKKSLNHNHDDFPKHTPSINDTENFVVNGINLQNLHGSMMISNAVSNNIENHANMSNDYDLEENDDDDIDDAQNPISESKNATQQSDHMKNANNNDLDTINDDEDWDDDEHFNALHSNEKLIALDNSADNDDEILENQHHMNQTKNAHNDADENDDMSLDDEMLTDFK